VVGPAPMGGDFVEIVIEEGPLRKAMFRFSGNILILSLLISCITATLVYLALHYLFVRPLNRLTTNMVSFREDPENPTRIIVPSASRDEIGIAERELGAMQRDLASMLQQKSHLAALGLAVSKINHDLRNLLASAQLFSDRLVAVPDPNVQRFAPKLMRSLERAIAFCQSTLSYGQVKEAPPDRRPVVLEGLVEEVRETLGLAADTPVRWVGAVERGLHVDADPDQLFRVILNLARNAMQALEARAPNDPGRDQLASPANARVPWWSSRSPTRARASPRRRAPTCSKRFRARPVRAVPASASPSRPNSCERTAARFVSSMAPSGRRSASSSRTARSTSAPAAASASAPEAHRAPPIPLVERRNRRLKDIRTRGLPIRQRHYSYAPPAGFTPDRQRARSSAG
jgi:hypothetical protein